VIFRALVETARHALENSPTIDLTAAVATQQAQRDRLAQAHYVAGLGALGLRRRDESRREMAECLKISPDDLDAKNGARGTHRAGMRPPPARPLAERGVGSAREGAGVSMLKLETASRSER